MLDASAKQVSFVWMVRNWRCCLVNRYVLSTGNSTPNPRHWFTNMFEDFIEIAEKPSWSAHIATNAMQVSNYSCDNCIGVTKTFKHHKLTVAELRVSFLVFVRDVRSCRVFMAGKSLSSWKFHDFDSQQNIVRAQDSLKHLKTPLLWVMCWVVLGWVETCWNVTLRHAASRLLDTLNPQTINFKKPCVANVFWNSSEAC